MENAREIITKMTGKTVNERKGARLLFPFWLTSKMNTDGLENLDLGTRAYNALRRAGYSTVGQLAEGVTSENGLSSIRNLGAKSFLEVKEKLFVYQFNSLSDAKKREWIDEVVKMNKSFHEYDII